MTENKTKTQNQESKNTALHMKQNFFNKQIFSVLNCVV